jgi:glycosyltransferase involved in cell wall biosynthesis
MGAAANLPKAPVSVIVLTYNEEVNIKACLESAKNLTNEIFLVDSHSTDRTLEIARDYTGQIYQNNWENWAVQRNWALANLPLKHDWVLFLDADERLTPSLIVELNTIFNEETKKNKFYGYYISRRFIFLGKEIRWGICKGGLIELRLFNRHYCKIRERGGQEVYISEGPVGFMREPMIHEDKKPLSAWIERHNNYSTFQAKDLWSLRNSAKKIDEISNQDKYLYYKEKFRNLIWNKLPLGIRPFLFFGLNYIIRIGILDGAVGFIYHFLREFWFPLLVDAKLYELTMKNKQNETDHPK